MIPKGFPNRTTLEFLHCTLITSNVTDYKKAGILPVARAALTLYNNRERQIRDKRSKSGERFFDKADQTIKQPSL